MTRTNRRMAAFGVIEELEPRTLLSLNPTGDEQLMLEFLNRMRMDPAAELAKLTSSLGNPARSSDPDIDSALTFFGVNGTMLASAWASLTAAPPLAWNENLYNSAAFHSGQMIEWDQQSHQIMSANPPYTEPDLRARATNAGYPEFNSSLGENIFAFANSVLYGHAGFAIDWGDNPPSGVQNPPGHRNNMMSTGFREVGIRILTDNDPDTDVGPLVITQDFGGRSDQGNPFLLGVVYDDTSHDSFYSSGEGLGGVTVTASGLPGMFMTTTFSAGGYQMQIPAGTYDVTFSGGSYGAPVTFHNIVVGAQNVKADAIKGQGPPAPEIEIRGNGAAITDGDTTPSTADFTDFGSAGLVGNSVTRTFSIFNLGNLPLHVSGMPRIVITGANAADFSIVNDGASDTVAAGGNMTFSIKGDPSGLGARIATVTVTSDDDDEGTYTFRIRVTGVNAPEADVTGNGVSILDGDTTPSLADVTTFGELNVDGATQIRTYTIHNLGTATLTLTGNVTITGSTDFTVTMQPSLSIAAGGMSIFKVRFNPSGGGFKNATVSFGSNDADENPYNFAIRGKGLLIPDIDVLGNAVHIVNGDSTPSATDFTAFGAKAVAHGMLTRTFTIRNIGSGVLNLTGSPRVTITGANPADFTVTLLPAATVGALGGSVTFKVKFDPTAVGQRNAIVRIASNDPDESPFTFSIRGTGT